MPPALGDQASRDLHGLVFRRQRVLVEAGRGRHAVRQEVECQHRNPSIGDTRHGEDVLLGEGSHDGNRPLGDGSLIGEGSVGTAVMDHHLRPPAHLLRVPGCQESVTHRGPRGLCLAGKRQQEGDPPGR